MVLAMASLFLCSLPSHLTSSSSFRHPLRLSSYIAPNKTHLKFSLASSLPRGVSKEQGQAALVFEGQESKEQQPVPEETPRIRELFSIHSPFNAITILEVPQNMPSEYAGSRILLLDESGNIHSIHRQDCKWTGFYWDQFATLPAIVPEGPIAILGLGGGTAARLILDLWPSCRLDGWEIDEILLDMARMYLGLSELEVPTACGGGLQVHVGDALLPSATVDGGYAGIMVDLFSDGGILPQLQQADTWFELKRRLRYGGRIMINCGGICVEKSDPKSSVEDGTWTWEDGGYAKDATLRAMFEAFPGQICWRKLGSKADNFMALTGPLPDLSKWAAALPEKLQDGLNDWKPFIL